MSSSNRAATLLTVANPVFLGIRELCHSNERQIVENNEEREALEIGLIANFVYLELIFFYLTTLDLGWHGITFMYLAAKSHVFHYWSVGHCHVKLGKIMTLNSY